MLSKITPYLLATIATMMLFGCGEEQSSPPPPTTKPVEPPCQVNWDESVQDLNRTWQRSVYDHSCNEHALNQNTFAVSSQPGDHIQYQNIFDRERELYGYNPRFIPGRPYFDANNSPWMIVNNMNQLDSRSLPAKHIDPVTGSDTGKALHALTYDDRVYSSLYSDNAPCDSCDSYLVRMTNEGKWVSISLRQLELEFDFRQNGDGLDGYRYRYIEQVYFQNNGDVFFKLDHGVIRYQASTQTWHGYKKNWTAQMEMVGNGSQPPLFIKADTNNKLYAINRLIVTDSGELTWQSETINLGLSLGLYRGSSAVVWYGNTLHIAGMSHDATMNNRQDYNTGQYYVRYQLGSGSGENSDDTDIVFMGWSGSTSQTSPDSHNQPIVLLDSAQRLHFISGAHNHQIWHRSSLLPISDAQWSNHDQLWPAQVTSSDKFTAGPMSPVSRYPNDAPLQNGVDYVGQEYGRYTYVHAQIGQDDRLYIAMRNTASSDEPQGYRLEWITGEPLGDGSYSWQDHGVIVQPNWSQYSNYTQKLHLDKQGNLYLLYTYEIQNFSDTTWYNRQERRSKQSQSQCAELSSASDCIDVKTTHYSLWPNERLEGSSSRYSQAFQHDPVLLYSDDRGLTWSLATTDHFKGNLQR